jgi:hypothetical protein
LAVAALASGCGQRLQLRVVDPALAPGDFFRAGDLEALAPLDGLMNWLASSIDSWVPVSSQA